MKLDQDLMRKAKIVAASRDQTVIEYLEEMIAPIIQRDVEQELRKLAGEGSQASSAPRRPKAKGE